jgi:hypothetical protein
LYETKPKAVRFTNTFRSSVIPGQERNLSNTPADRSVKLYSQDKQYFENESKRAAVQAVDRERCKSAVPTKVSDSSEQHLRSLSTFELMSKGRSRVRNNNTFKSQVMPLSQSTPDFSMMNTGTTEKQNAFI